VDETPSRSFFSTLERSEWPPHAAEPFTGPLPDYEPACGRRQFSKEDLAALLGELRGFAEYLYGRETFRALYAAGDTGADGARVIVGFGVRTPTETLTLAYRPEARAFELVPYADAHETLIAGLASWASDLLAALRFDLFSGYMLVGRYRKWNRASDWLRCDLDADLALYTHPLCHPGRTLALYRRTVAKLAGNVGSVRVSASPKSLDER
jgi:hypothetical protein